jgi:flavin reductase (DIM6/NTAB) family NADH-FMN oxidoreductase RutF
VPSSVPEIGRRTVHRHLAVPPPATVTPPTAVPPSPAVTPSAEVPPSTAVTPPGEVAPSAEVPPSGEVKPAGPDDLRRLFRRHAAAVAVITTTHHDAPVGLLVTSLASVSTQPPLISFNVSRGSSSWPALSEAQYLGVHVLAAGQSELADRFARKGADRFAAPTSWRLGPHRVPLVSGCAAASVAVVEQRVAAGDHVIVVARLLRVETEDSTSPLVHHEGTYHVVEPHISSIRLHIAGSDQA